MQRWNRWLRGRFGLALGFIGTIAVPVVGVVVLRFLFDGAPVDLSAAAAPTAVISPVVPRPTLSQAEQAPTVLPPVTPTGTPTPTATPSPTPTPVLVRTVNATLGLNVRTDPNVQSAVARVLHFETEVRLTGAQRTSEGLLWVEVEPDGWVQARYLDP